MHPHRPTLEPPAILSTLPTTATNSQHPYHRRTASELAHYQQSQAGPSAHHDLQPQQQVSHDLPEQHAAQLLGEDGLPLKRKRGRPKGSKTKNRRSEVLAASVDYATAGAGPSTRRQGEEEEGAGSGDEHYAAGGASEQNRPQATQYFHIPPGLSDSSRMGVGHPIGSSARSTSGPVLGASSELPATLPPEASAHHQHSRSGQQEQHQSSSIQNFYDFQWQVISLCSVFYESAGDLVVCVLPPSSQLSSYLPMVVSAAGPSLPKVSYH